MPKQKGIIKLKGSMGGITFYKRNGQNLSRETNGPDKNKILNDPNFIRTRENNQEFAGAATIGKAMRMGLVQEFDEMSDTDTTSRIVKLIKSIITLGPGPRGQRTFEPVTYKDMFVNFPFSEKKIFDSVFLAPYSISVNPTKTEATMTIPDFNTGNFVHAPSGATHFRVINLISVLDRYVFNVTSKKYEPVGNNDNMLNGFDASGYLPLGVDVGSPTVIVATLPVGSVLLASSALISCVGIEFYQIVNGSYYLFSSDNAMKIQNVY